MNDTIKVSLTIELEGSTLVRKSEPEVIKYSLTKRDLDSSKKWRGKDGLEMVKKGSFRHYPIIVKPATQHIKIGEETYKYMISNECPFWVKPKAWKNMSETQRLETHLQRICEHKGGKSFTYAVIED